MIFRKRQRYLVAIDIGTHHMRAGVALLRQDGVWRLVCVGESGSTGVTRGEVTDLDKAADSLREAVEQAEELAGIEIPDAFLGLSGAHLRGEIRDGAMVLEGDDPEVNRGHVDALREQAEALTLVPERSHVVTIDRGFRVDGARHLSLPVGVPGRRLEGSFLVVHGVTTRLKSAISRLPAVGLNHRMWQVTPAASARAALTEEQMRPGALVLDLGHGLTHFALYLDGRIECLGAVPAAGAAVTGDIASAFTPMRLSVAERLKCEHGSVTVDCGDPDRLIRLEPVLTFPGCDVYYESLALVMRARWEETFLYVKRRLPPGALDRISAGVVLTGGSSRTDGIEELARQVFGVPAHRLVRHELEGDPALMTRPELSTVLGLLSEAVQMETAPAESGLGSFLGKVLGG
jgi:cell division protein FtsA